MRQEFTANSEYRLESLTVPSVLLCLGHSAQECVMYLMSSLILYVFNSAPEDTWSPALRPTDLATQKIGTKGHFSENRHMVRSKDLKNNHQCSQLALEPLSECLRLGRRTR